MPVHAPDLLIGLFDHVRSTTRSAVRGLDPDQLAHRPGGTGNSIAWLAWHLTRVQDDHVADVADTEQVWTADGWAERFALPFPAGDIGYGQSSDEAGAVRAEAALLTGYLDAVCDRTVDYLRGLAADDFDRIVDDRWDPPVTLGVRLTSVANDDLQHAGQAAYVRGLL